MTKIEEKRGSGDELFKGFLHILSYFHPSSASSSSSSPPPPLPSSSLSCSSSFCFFIPFSSSFFCFFFCFSVYIFFLVPTSQTLHFLLFSFSSNLPLLVPSTLPLYPTPISLSPDSSSLPSCFLFYFPFFFCCWLFMAFWSPSLPLPHLLPLCPLPLSSSL